MTVTAHTYAPLQRLPARPAPSRWYARLAVAAALLLCGGSAWAATSLPGFALRLLTGDPRAAAPVLAGYQLRSAGPAGDEYELRFAAQTAHGPEVAVLLGRKQPGFRAFATTPSFRVSWQSLTPGVVTPPGVAALTDAVVAQITLHDNGQLRLPAPERQRSSTPGAAATAVDTPLRAATGALLLTSLAVLLWLLISDAKRLRALSRRCQVGLAGLLALGAGLRFLAPKTLVMVHMGHELFELAGSSGPPPKYGPAAPVWLGAWFSLTGPGWPAAVTLSQLCSSLSLALLPGLVLRWGGTPAAALGALLGVACTPVLIHDAATESILVPAMLATVAAASAASRWRTAPLLAPLAASACAAVAMLARPELLVLAPLALLAGGLFAQPAFAAADLDQSETTPPQKRGAAVVAAWLVAVALLLAVAVARAIQLEAVMEVERALGNTPRVFATSKLGLLFDLLVDAWLRKNGLLWTELVPAGGWLWLGLLVWKRPARLRPALVCFGLAWLFLAPTSLDLPWISVPRVQAPAMWWFAAAGGAAAGVLWSALAAPARWPAALLSAAAAVYTLPAAFYVHPSELEERAFAAAVRHLPPQATLVTRTHADPPDERVHLGVATGLLGPGHTLLPIESVLSGELVPGRDGRVFAWLGTRCAMRPCERVGRHPSCERLAREFELVTVDQVDYSVSDERPPHLFQQRTPTHVGPFADLDFPWCWQQQVVEMRLVEVKSGKPDQPGPP